MALDNLVKRAIFIDKMDTITGPLSALCFQSGSETLATLGTAINLVEMAVKIPYMFSYHAQTKDSKGVFYWGLKEMVANFNPTLGFIDIVPFYTMRTKYFTKYYDNSSS